MTFSDNWEVSIADWKPYCNFILTVNLIQCLASSTQHNTTHLDIILSHVFCNFHLNHPNIYHYRSTHFDVGINAILSLLDSFAQEGGSAFSVMSAAVNVSNQVEVVAKRFAVVSKNCRCTTYFPFFVRWLWIHGNMHGRTYIIHDFTYCSYKSSFFPS